MCKEVKYDHKMRSLKTEYLEILLYCTVQVCEQLTPFSAHAHHCPPVRGVWGVSTRVVTPLKFQIVMEDIEDPLASNQKRPGAAEPNHALQTAPLSPPGPTDTVSPTAPSHEQNDKSTAHHMMHEAGDEEEEMEMMEQDEMEFLEGNAQLGSLKSGKITR